MLKASNSAAIAASFALLLSGDVPLATAATTVIPKDSFSSFNDFWAYLYPWGSDHNGSARMAESNIVVESGTLTLKATPTSNASPPTSTADPYPAIHYISGAVHALEQITVTAENSYTVYGEFSAPTAVGTWPAFWLTAASGWPPEVDIGEWKGTADNWYNTFNTSSEVKSTTVAWPADLSFHSLQAVLTAEANGADVKIDFYMDDALQTTQYGRGYVGKALNLIINLQMEGSSGTPGPADGATYQARNVEVTIN
ncbi:glycoside hydrolase family 16 protein [Schizophyllum commune H4-8]|uniref:Glycoside hydrolase family 16 protein n=1 Tax=Schizophyllum commune (strain H4-8 / FGSC 9210) TaxID=578458 RepID=D8QDB3_SCHCM|nr:glycoside hydrolase family 16 protein [Schizophyllum commune H4-8]KAI5888790.1 glycoside hydrolase family 16 protein [Schizophyllum commune H4-8]